MNRSDCYPARTGRWNWLVVLAGILSGVAPAGAFTAADADTAFEAFNHAFYSVSDSRGYYKKDTTGGRSDFWKQAEEIEMILDVFERTGEPAHKQMVTESIDGFLAHHGTNWLGNQYNDDLMWMIIACARGYLATGNAGFKERAKYHFDAVYARAWDDVLGGGMWWTTNNTSKNACINGPAAIAACLLYRLCGERSYLDKAQALFAWEQRTLVDPASGRVWDNIRRNGIVGRRCFSYNQGTFIGAANLLYHLTHDSAYLEAGLKAARYARTNLCREGILPAYGGGDAGGFNGIFVRWMARFAADQHLWPEFHSWLLENAETAWKARRSDDLSWQRWRTPTPDGVLDSWSCSDTVVILQVVPPNLP